MLVIEEALGGSTARQAFELGNVRIGAATTAAPEPASLAAILQAAVLALLGGVILNLMPCVFPVLSIKVLGLVEHSGQSPERVRKHGLAYTAGVLAAFGALGVLLLGLRAAGLQVGWGFQLQSPVVIAVLAYVLLAVGLNLSGVFHLGGIAARRRRRPHATPDAALGLRRLVLRPACSRPSWRRRARLRSWQPPSALPSCSRPASRSR